MHDVLEIILWALGWLQWERGAFFFLGHSPLAMFILKEHMMRISNESYHVPHQGYSLTNAGPNESTSSIMVLRYGIHQDPFDTLPSDSGAS